MPVKGETASQETTRKAGRGGLALAAGKIYFIFLGLIQQIVLQRVLGLDGYGGLSTVLSLASITYNPIVSSSIQGVSRAVAQSPDAERPQALRRTVGIHFLLSVPVALAFFFAAPLVGESLRAPHLVSALRIVSFVILFYGLYTPLVGALNGQQKFFHQAGLDAAAATLRTCGLVGLGWWGATQFGRGVDGAATGFLLASATVCLLACGIVGFGKPGEGGPSLKAHLGFIAPLVLGWIVFNLLLQADFTMLRRLAADAAIESGGLAKDADKLAGAYRATQLFCFLPFQMLLAATFILFPMLAQAHRDRDREAVARYVRHGVRLAVILAGLMVSVSSGLSASLLRLVFSDEIADLAGESMQVLTLGYWLFAIFLVFTTVLNSLGRERISMAITASAFGLVVVLCFVRVPGTPFGKELLWQTATSTSLGIFFATSIGYLAVKRVAGSVVSWLSVGRVVLAMTVSISLGRWLPYEGKLFTLVHCAIVSICYCALLIGSREIGRNELGMLKTILAKTPTPAA